MEKISNQIEGVDYWGGIKIYGDIDPLFEIQSWKQTPAIF